MKSTLFIILFLAILALVAVAQPTREVTTMFGTIRGYLANGGQGHEFRGIKYTNPYNRWEHSTLSNTPFGTFDALHDSPGCPQECHLPPHTCPISYDEKTCLSLNIFTPLSAETKLPVMVYLHGGNYFQGAVDTPLVCLAI